MKDMSLITSLYQSEAYLPNYIESCNKLIAVLNKADIDTEIIIIGNDTSNNERKYIEKLDTVYSNENISFISLFVAKESLYKSWNRGIKVSSGNIIGFWNVDDVRYPAAMIKSLSLFKTGAELVYFPFWQVSKRRRYQFVNLLLSKIFNAPKFQSPKYLRPVNCGQEFLFNKISKVKIDPPSAFNRDEFTRSFNIGPFFLFKRNLYGKVGPFDEQFCIAGDFEWQIRAAKMSLFVYCDEIAGEFYVDGTGLSGRGDSLHSVENNVIYLRHGILDKIQDVDQHLLKRYKI